MTPPGIQGIDVSYAQPRVDWQAVREAGVEFGYIRQGYRLYTDTMWRQHAADAHAASFPVGAYHFAYVDKDPLDEVKRFIDDGAVDAPGLVLRPVLDLETMNGDKPRSLVLYWGRTWLEEVSSRCGVLPMLYTYPAFWMGLGAEARVPFFAQHPLWIAHYGVSKPNVPAPWGDYSMWQWSGDGSVPGVVGKVDRNVLHPGGNMDWLQWRYSRVTASP